MKLACLHTGRLLERRLSGLSAAEGLRLEEHLAICSACRSDANLLGGLSSLASAAHVGLTVAARERAIANAFSASASARAPRVVPPRRVGMLLLGAAAALVIGFGIAPYLAPSGHVLAGEVRVAGGVLTEGASLADEAQLHAGEAAVVALGHARVELRADSDVRWHGAERKLELQRGSALFDVDPAQHRSFEVQTAAFTVRVLGTRFEVTERAVVVLSGRVSVQPTAAGASAQPVVLAAGTSKTRFALPEAASVPADRAAQDISDNADIEQAQNTLQPVASARTRAPGKQRGNKVDASALLDRARSQLAARELSQTRATLELARPHLHDSALRAQALSLEAECALQERHFDAARDTYLQVARKYDGMPAAETALFAAARIEAEHGEPARAVQLLEGYLAKHPHGSFVREAERRLKLLPRKPAAP